ncbi:translation initiation factor eIF-1A protein [Marine Group I thaumarchaeote SCGC RSA3]|uniref:Translation initiation factor eIF-1A protein n=1 Tax=Marine Group I thaumarchaeote SCGC RSA3 TaxID=1503183 RepID=A0A087RSS4_9ARCH|nr:translation initiation factor eIF-1A protein [Marine Group I thaumarchaeote SCGC RSA3]
MGKRQVKNEKALKEIRLPETDEEMFGRVIKMMGVYIATSRMVKAGKIHSIGLLEYNQKT